MTGGQHNHGMKRKHSYDPRCFDLAALFLGDEPALHTGANMDELAHLIQQTIEDYISSAKSEVSANGQFGVGA